MKLDDACDLYFQYLRVEKGVSNETIRNYAYDLKQFFIALPKQSTDDMLSTDITDFVTIQMKNQLSVPTILRRISSTMNFYLFLEREHIIDFVVKDFDRPRKMKNLPKIISVEQVEDLLNAPDLSKDEGFRDRTMLELMYCSGLRVSELLSLKVKQVNLEKQIIDVIGKGNKQRKVPVGEYALDFVKQYIDSGYDAYGVIIAIIGHLPAPQLWLVLILLTMILFYATSFDSIAYTASCYSYKKLEGDEKPNKGIQLLWCVLLILLPIALVFAESSINSLQTISIVSAFPLGIIMILILISFFIDSKKRLKEIQNDKFIQAIQSRQDSNCNIE